MLVVPILECLGEALQSRGKEVRMWLKFCRFLLKCVRSVVQKIVFNVGEIVPTSPTLLIIRQTLSLTVEGAADAEARGAGSRAGAALGGALGGRVAGAVPRRDVGVARRVPEAHDGEERQHAALPRPLPTALLAARVRRPAVKVGSGYMHVRPVIVLIPRSLGCLHITSALRGLEG